MPPQLAQDKAPAATKLATAAKKPSIYDKSADAQAQLEKAKELAKRDDKRILVMFGGDWCGWCHKLHELFASDAEIRKILSYEYVLVMVDTTAPGAEELLEQVQGGAQPGRASKGVGYPFLSVLDADGKVVTRRGPTRSKKATITSRSRQGVLEQCRSRPRTPKWSSRWPARASSEDKRVFLSFGAPGAAGATSSRTGWPTEVASILDRDFVIVKVDIDRMTHGKI